MLDELSSLAYKVELQTKVKRKGEASKPLNRAYPFHKPPQNPSRRNYPSQNRINPPTAAKTPSKSTPKPTNARRCFRCQGLGHIASECPNKRLVTLVEYKSNCEHLEELEECRDKELFLTEEMEE